MQDQGRRNFFLKGGLILATGAISGTSSFALAGPKHDGMHDAVKTDMKYVCATCSHWGGERKVSMDQSHVQVKGEGWCNHADSEHYHTKTPPLKKHKTTWKKWGAIK